LSALAYDDPAYNAGDYPSQILHCEGGNFLLEAAVRSLGIPARTIGSTYQQSLAAAPDGTAAQVFVGFEVAPGLGFGLVPVYAALPWDADGDGFLGAGEVATAGNGHRWTQVWLGPDYGWLLFDATPATAFEENDSGPPPIVSQWKLMTECAGPVEAHRLILTVGSGKLLPMYVPEQSVGGRPHGANQGYNAKAKFSLSEHWGWTVPTINMSGACWLTPIAFSAPGPDPSGVSCQVTWSPWGRWDLDPDATLTLTLELDDLAGNVTTGIPMTDIAGGPVDVGVPYDRGAVSFYIPHGTGNGLYRVRIAKDGDEETGGFSNQAYVAP